MYNSNFGSTDAVKDIPDLGEKSGYQVLPMEEQKDNFSDLPENPTFGGELVQALEKSEKLITGEVQPVPLTKQNLYTEEYMTNLSMGQPNYISILAKRYKERPSRISTGIPDLDYVTGGGWVNCGLSVVCAAPNVGKTTILLQSALQMSQQGTTVVYITNDMRKLDLEAKIISQISYSLKGEDCLSLSDITNENALCEDDEHIKQIGEKLSTLKYLHIRDMISDEDFDKACEKDVTLIDKDKLTRIVTQYTSVYKKVIFMVDSLQQIAGYLGTGKEGVDTLLRIFKEISAKAPVVMISTLNRGGYSKTGEIEFTDLKESGSIEYNADLIVTMVPKFFVIKEKDTTMSDFKKMTKRDIMIACKKSRDSEERDRVMTLFTKGCTFIPYEEKWSPIYGGVSNGGEVEPVPKKRPKVAYLPPDDVLKWTKL